MIILYIKKNYNFNNSVNYCALLYMALFLCYITELVQYLVSVRPVS